MGDSLIMTKKARNRKTMVEKVLSNQMSRQEASKRLGLSIRQFRRILARYRQEGDAGLIHKSQGRQPNNAYNTSFRDKVLKRYKERYLDFGPTFASEKLEEDDGLKVHPETLRLWLKEAALWHSKRKRRQHRSRRARRARFGDMLQMDGSIHAWLPGVDGKQCLMNLVDDATGKTLSLMDYGETTRAALSLLKWWIQDAGIPMSIYVDLKSLYVSPKSLRQKEQDGETLVEPEWLTHFSKACKKLGIEIIKAYSPQAKGRVERSHAVYQDRFAKELKLKNITTLEGANQLLSGGFINRLNEKFAKAPALDEDAHVALIDDDLDQILCFETARQVKNDWTFQHNNQHYQINKSPSSSAQPKQKIAVRIHLDESISAWSKAGRLDISPIDEREKKASKVITSKTSRSEISRSNKHKTPWSQFNPEYYRSKNTHQSHHTASE